MYLTSASGYGLLGLLIEVRHNLGCEALHHFHSFGVGLPIVARQENAIDAYLLVDRQSVDNLGSGGNHQIFGELLNRLLTRQGFNNTVLDDARAADILEAFVILVGIL